MKYIIYIILFFFCYKIFLTNGTKKFIWFISGILMINSTYSPITLSNSHLTLSFVYLISLFKDTEIKKDLRTYPLRNISISIIIVYFLISLFCNWQPLYRSLYLSLLDFLISFMMLFVGYHAISKNEDYDKILRVIKPILFISAIYGLVCFILKDNPYNKLIGISDVGINYDYFETQRGYRISGFCNTSNPHAHLLTVLSFILVNRDNSRSNIFLLILSVLNILLSDSRAPLADLCVLIFSFIIFTKRSQRVRIIIPIAIAIIILLSIPILRHFVNNIFLKIADTFASEGNTNISGSSIVLRLNQFESAGNYFIEAPIFGHGFGYYGSKIFIPNTTNNGLYGMESYIMWLMVEQGVIMIILSSLFYFKLLYSLFKYKKKSYYKVPLCLTFVLISYLLLNRPTDVYEYYLPFIGIGLKLLEINKNSTNILQLKTLYT